MAAYVPLPTHQEDDLPGPSPWAGPPSPSCLTARRGLLILLPLGLLCSVLAPFRGAGTRSHPYAPTAAVPPPPHRIHLATAPTCGSYQDDLFRNHNHGIDLGPITTIVALGDSWTDTSARRGELAAPPLPNGTSPFYGGRTTNGPTWVEAFARDHGAAGQPLDVKSFAVAGSVVDATLWPSMRGAGDMVTQVATFLDQNMTLDVSRTLVTVFFGINDRGAAHTDGNHFPEAAERVVNLTTQLVDYGLHNFIFLNYAWEEMRHDYGNTIWKAMKRLGVNFAAVELSPLFGDIFTRPQAFGYASAGSCLDNWETTEGACDDPEGTLYWIPYHPSRPTHRLIGEWVGRVLGACGS